MKKMHLQLVAVLLLGHVIVATSYAAPVDEKIIAQLKTFRLDYTNALLKKEPEKIVSLYGEKIRLMREYQKTITDKKNALLYHQSFAAKFDVQKYEQAETDILDLGSQVVEVGTFSMRIKPKGNDEATDMTGKYMIICERSANGTLSIVADAWNYDRRYETLLPQLKFENVSGVVTAFQTAVPIENHISFELAALNQLMGVTISQYDAKRWAQFYADDAILMPNHSPIRTGRKAIDDYLTPHVKELPVFEKLDIRNDRIDDLGQYVIEYASHVANWRTGEYSGVGTGKNIRIWRREPDCSLKIVRHIGMYD